MENHVIVAGANRDYVLLSAAGLMKFSSFPATNSTRGVTYPLADNAI
jgi:hypothetical protein